MAVKRAGRKRAPGAARAPGGVYRTPVPPDPTPPRFAQSAERGIVQPAPGSGRAPVTGADRPPRTRLARRALEHERFLLELTLRQTPDAIFISDSEGKLLLVNTPGEQLAGRGMEGQSVDHLFDAAGQFYDAAGAFVPPERRPLAAALRGKITVGCDIRMVNRDGIARDLRFSAAPVRDQDGRIVAAIATARDLTEHKRIERQLEDERRLLEATVRQAADGIAIYDAQGTPLLINDATRRMAGLDSEGAAPSLSEADWGTASLPGGTPLPPEQRPMMLALRGRTTVGQELRVVRSDGRAYDLRISAAPVRDLSGRIVAAVATLADITEQKRMAASLARHRAWDVARAAIGEAAVAGEPLDCILHSALDAVARPTEASVGLIRLVDPATRDLVLAAERNLSAAYRQAAYRITWGERLAGQVAATGEGRVVEDLAAEPDLSLLRDLSGLPLASLMCFPLVTQREVLGTVTIGHPKVRGFDAADAAEFQDCANVLAGAVRSEKLREEYRREAEARALLLRELDHRVRNTLATLIGLLHLTAENVDTPTGAILLTTAERVARIADVHASLSGRGRHRADLHRLIEMVAQSVFGLMEPAGSIRWSVTVPPVQLHAAQATNLALVLHELFTNCVKHAFADRSAGTVNVEGRHDGRTLDLTVCDDGRGAPPSPVRAGTGLNIVETLATHSLRGALWMAEPRGGGLLTHLRFPLEEGVEPGDHA